MMDLKVALQELANDVKDVLSDRIRRYGVNPKVGRNTLEGSDLEKSIQVTATEDTLTLQIADYWEFVSRGWERTHNYPNTMQRFVRNINKWVRKKNIRFGEYNQTQIVWIVINKIWRYGIRPRPFMVYDEDGDLTKMIPELNNMIDEWFDKLFDEITKELDKYFN